MTNITMEGENNTNASEGVDAWPGSNRYVFFILRFFSFNHKSEEYICEINRGTYLMHFDFFFIFFLLFGLIDLRYWMNSLCIILTSMHAFSLVRCASTHAHC